MERIAVFLALISIALVACDNNGRTNADADRDSNIDSDTQGDTDTEDDTDTPDADPDEVEPTICSQFGGTCVADFAECLDDEESFAWTALGCDEQFCCVPKSDCTTATGECHEATKPCPDGTASYRLEGCDEETFNQCCVPTHGEAISETYCELIGGECVMDPEMCGEYTFGWNGLGCENGCCLPAESCTAVGGQCTSPDDACAPGTRRTTYVMDCKGSARCCIPNSSPYEPQAYCEFLGGTCVHNETLCFIDTFPWDPLGCTEACCLPDSSCEALNGYCEYFLTDCREGTIGHTPMDCPQGRSAQCCVPTVVPGS